MILEVHKSIVIFHLDVHNCSELLKLFFDLFLARFPVNTSNPDLSKGLRVRIAAINPLSILVSLATVASVTLVVVVSPISVTSAGVPSRLAIVVDRIWVLVRFSTGLVSSLPVLRMASLVESVISSLVLSLVSVEAVVVLVICSGIGIIVSVVKGSAMIAVVVLELTVALVLVTQGIVVFVVASPVRARAVWLVSLVRAGGAELAAASAFRHEVLLVHL